MNRTEDQIRELARIVFGFYSDTSDRTARLVAGDALELIEERETVMLIARRDIEDAMRVLQTATAALEGTGALPEDSRAEIQGALASIEGRLSDAFCAHFQVGKTG